MKQDRRGTTLLHGKVNRVFSIVRTSVLFFFAILPVALHGQNAMPFAAAADSFLYIKVQLEPSIMRSEEHTSELQSPCNLVCRLLLEKKKNHYPLLHHPF